MDLAKQIRLNRLFSHPSGRLVSVAVDHFVGYQKGLPEGLVNVPETIGKLVEGKPDAITMLKGMAKSAWGPHAGKVPLIIQAVTFTADDAIIQPLARPEEALRLGADAAGGPRCESLQSALELMARVVASGARGATIGRNLWCTPDPTRALRAFRAVIHDGMSATEALESTGLGKPRAKRALAEVGGH